jgi:hypothetical protein
MRSFETEIWVVLSWSTVNDDTAADSFTPIVLLPGDYLIASSSFYFGFTCLLFDLCHGVNQLSNLFLLLLGLGNKLFASFHSIGNLQIQRCNLAALAFAYHALIRESSLSFAL